MFEKCQTILIVTGRPEREQRTNEKIRNAIIRNNPQVKVCIIHRHDSQFLTKALEISPQVIVTYPFTAITTAAEFYVLKYLLGCSLVCYRTEGLLIRTDPQYISGMVGLEKYGSNFVDCEIFWSSLSAKLIGDVLLEQNKLSSPERIKYFGHSFFEDYVKPDCEFEKVLPAHISGKINQYPREKTVLIVTGFSYADYSREDIIVAGDLVDKESKTFNQDLERRLGRVEETKRLRQKWMDAIIESATNNPDMLFVVKIHPSEIVHYRKINKNPYAIFDNFSNILLVTETLPCRALLPHCSLLLHYGSTAMLEAYLLKVPTVTGRYSKNRPTILEELSTIMVEVAEVPSVISGHADNPVKFERSSDVEKFLEDQLCFKIGQPYNPSDKIASFLLSLLNEEPQLILSDDKYLTKSFEQLGGAGLINQIIAKGVEKANSGNYKQALSAFLDNALRLSEFAQLNVSGLQYARAFCFYKVGLLREAFAAAKEELANNPNDTKVQQLYNELSSSLTEKQRCKSGHTNEFDRMVPKIFAVETVLGCNLKCPECATGGDIITRKKGCMSFEQFKVIADKIRPFCEYLYLHIWGEPLLNKDIFKMIEYASSFTKTNISTNANLLTKEKAELLITSGVTDIIVSIDGVTQQVYEHYRRGGAVDKALSALKQLQELNLRYGNKVNIAPQFIVFKHNQHEMESFGEFCRSIGLSAVYKAPYIRSDSIYEHSSIPEYVRPCYSNIESLKQAMSEKCDNPKEVFTVLLDGSCVLCCYDHNAKTNYGNIYDQNVLDIWNSPAYRKDRFDILNGSAPKFCVENCLKLISHLPVTEESEVNKKIANVSPVQINESADSGENNDRLSNQKPYGRRQVCIYELDDLQKAVTLARKSFDSGNFNQAFDIYEQLSVAYPDQAIEILAEAYDKYQLLPNRDRYSLYQSRIYNFNIGPKDKVLDIGSGHNPFPYATHLSDIATDDNSYGRGGQPFKYVEGKPVHQCNVENLPFADKEFDFIYCSHILEHTQNPERACEEIMRVARRGYIETPAKAKDLWLNSAKVSNHRWALEKEGNILVFNEYGSEEIEGLGCDILQKMHSSPETKREKALSALIYLKPDFVNTMFLWEDKFKYTIRRKPGTKTIDSGSAKIAKPVENNGTCTNSSEKSFGKNSICKKNGLKFLQVHTFYPQYLKSFYDKNNMLSKAAFRQQPAALIKDGFSGIHMFAPYMKEQGYDSQLIIANNPFSQSQWLKENNLQLNSQQNWQNEILRIQIEKIRPDILYLSDPITFDSMFVRTLTWRPDLIIGWRAADIPDGTDWSEFDLILSGLSGVREAALNLGAKAAEDFVPAFIPWVLNEISEVKPVFDVVFSGTWGVDQHQRRNNYLNEVAMASESPENAFTFGLYLNANSDIHQKEISNRNLGARFGIDMHRALRSGRIVLDARGDIRFKNTAAGDKNAMLDMAKNETMNMRIFETTGSGAFLLTEYYDNLEKYFEIGKEIEVFRNEKELIEKIRYYLAHPKEREDIARRGQQRCLRDHSMAQRCAEFDTIIKKHLLHKSKANKPSTVTANVSLSGKAEATNSDIKASKVLALMQKALDSLNANQNDIAFNFLNEAKSLKSLVEGLDFLRAIYFMRKNKPAEAREALKEELRYFPNSENSIDLLNRINKQYPQTSSVNIQDAEFLEILEAVRPYTMLSEQRLYSLFSLTKKVCIENIHGNVVECGVAGGGSTALMAYVIKKYSRVPRILYAFDSFEGMPTPTEHDATRGVSADSTGWGAGTCAAPESSVRQICEKLSVSNIVRTVKGYFQDTLPQMRDSIGDIAFLHMDGDWYESTRSILENLYDSVVADGLIQVDDYGYWEGCKKAINEFEYDRNIKFAVNKIDGTGIWFSKPSVQPNSSTKSKTGHTKLNMLNLGCGNRYHLDWTNIDFQSRGTDVIAFDLNKPLPFEDESFDVVYHSHLLEHFPQSRAPVFTGECFRILKPGGIIRVVVPDLEQIARWYLKMFEKSMQGVKDAQERYEWIMLELFDQMVRNVSGGEMLNYWKQDTIPAEDFVIERVGSEVKNVLNKIRQNAGAATATMPQTYNKNIALDPYQIGRFRLSGEIHQWMYDRYSLGKLLKQAGFREVRVCRADESMIANFNSYLLDIEPDGSVRKPDSLFMEGRK